MTNLLGSRTKLNHTLQQIDENSYFSKFSTNITKKKLIRLWL